MYLWWLLPKVMADRLEDHITLKFRFDNAWMTGNRKLSKEIGGLEIICMGDPLAKTKSSHQCHMFTIFAGRETLNILQEELRTTFTAIKTLHGTQQIGTCGKGIRWLYNPPSLRNTAGNGGGANLSCTDSTGSGHGSAGQGVESL
jgi:hypothetical protein